MASQERKEKSTTTEVNNDDGDLSVLQGFPFFARLPNEIKDMIWHFALFPQLIRIDLEGGNTAVWEHPKWNSRTVSTKSLNSPLSKMYGDHYMFVMNVGYSSKGGPRVTPSFAFRPQHDTLYYPELLTQYHVFWGGAFVKQQEYQQLDIRDSNRRLFLSEIQSIAIGGVVQRFEAENVPITDHSSFYRVHYKKGWALGLDRIISGFPCLEELIIVSPTIEQLSASASALKEASKGRHGQFLSTDPAECQRLIEEQIKLFESYLNAEGKKLFERQMNHSYLEPREPSHPKISEWWKDPVVKWMTELELKARFGLKPDSRDLES
ncbi:uncharacterized protein LY89DRAFT_672722 [Mollisia scopiformis]|uniref:2EXR domain-containing protein n=1 Tax=Mollisia scopiformis TaxID=149040 RepID=A0A194X0N1_MOLSC|nr:uncharacterized protein LY89DRAFT_672722 [Mollisia scopiformis]KUJ13514.1 hypothetical protein LY89DRAFT_672722 [Mollisia scopiformis]